MSSARSGATRPRPSRVASRSSPACRSIPSPCRRRDRRSGSAAAPTPRWRGQAARATAGCPTSCSRSGTGRASTRSAPPPPRPAAGSTASPPRISPSSPWAATGSRRRRCGPRRSRSATPRTSSRSRASTASSARRISARSSSSAFAPPAAITSSSIRSARRPRSASRSSASPPTWCRSSVADLTGGQLVARVLEQAGVGHVFTLCGGHLLPIYDGCLDAGIALIDTRHEQAAAHCADAYARLTRGIGVAMVAPGPGLTDAVTGVANAYAARSPLLLIGGAAPLGLRGLGALQEMEQVALLRPITKGSFTVAETRQIPEVLTTAIRTALSGRPGPVFVEIPVDLLMTTIEDRLAPIPTAYVHRPRGAADPAALETLGRLLAGAERPVVVAGGGIWWDDAAAALTAFATRAGLPVFMNGAGRGALPTSHANAFAQARSTALARADLVLVLGAPLDFRLGYGRPPTFAEDAKVVMVDVDAAELGRNRPLALGLAGDLGAILRQALDVVPASMAARVAPWLEALRAKESESRTKIAAFCAADDVPISHYRLAAEIARVVSRETIVVGDGGDVVGCV